MIQMKMSALRAFSWKTHGLVYSNCIPSGFLCSNSRKFYNDRVSCTDFWDNRFLPVDERSALLMDALARQRVY